MTYVYREDVLAQLWAHGVHPTPETPPELVHEFVGDLYRFEIRRLRDRFRRQEIRREDYADHVVLLRRRYPLISLKPWQWLR